MSLTTVTIDTADFTEKYIEWYNHTEQQENSSLQLVKVLPSRTFDECIKYFERETIPYDLHCGKKLTEAFEQCYYTLFDELEDEEDPPYVFTDTRIYGSRHRFECDDCDAEEDLKPMGISPTEFKECMATAGPILGFDIDMKPLPKILLCQVCFENHHPAHKRR